MNVVLGDLWMKVKVKAKCGGDPQILEMPAMRDNHQAGALSVVEIPGYWRCQQRGTTTKESWSTTCR